MTGLVLIALVAAAGCGPSMATRQGFSEEFRSGRYLAAADMMGAPSLIARPSEPKHLLETLEVAASFRAAGRRTESCKLFDDTETSLKFYDQQLLTETSAQTLAALMVNDKTLPYRGKNYDGVMVNVYKGLNYLEDAQWDRARVELNRANERQRRAVKNYSTAIRKQKEVIANKSRSSPGLPIDQTLNNPQLRTLVDSKYQDLNAATANWAPYPDFVNPFASYVQGLGFFLMAEDASDYGKARESFRRVYGMTGNSKLVQGDIAIVEGILGSRPNRPNAPPMTWVLFENGLGPVKEEVRVDIPLLFQKVTYVGIALPVLRFRPPAYETVQVRSSSGEIAATEPLFNIDAVVAKEFQLELPQVVTRAVFSALLKTAAQYAAGEAGGGLGSALAGVYTFLSTGADTRIWTALPKNVQVARLPRPADGRFDVLAPDGRTVLAQVEVPKSRYSVVFVKIPAQGAPATYQTIASKD